MSEISSDGVDPAWQARRRQAAEEHSMRLEQRRQSESAKARKQIAEFVAQARGAEIPDVALRARSLAGNGSYRTHIRGWYIKRNRTIAIGTDGEFYVLSAPTSLASKVVGVEMTPSDPPLVVGAGGRDGESLDLSALLDLRIAAGITFE